ncbi:MAG: helix-turn-helix domain-containing protein [Candidatus Acidoferrales bacterium]
MARGRPPKGPQLVEGLDAPQEAKQRLQVILETIAGERSVSQACEVLGIGEAAFHKLRTQVLKAGLASLAPSPRGRPRRSEPEEDARVKELEAEVQELKIDLRAAQIREEMALLMPHLLERNDKKKRATTSGGRKRRKKKRR